MSAPPLFDGLTEVRSTLVADRRGQLTAPIAGAAGLSQEHASATAVAIGELVTVGEGAGLGQLELLLTTAPGRTTMTAVRAGAFATVALDPAKATSRVEKALRAWAPPA
ncbi:MAG TPA: hypothetical protein VF805_00880, partial [Anaeromyxobacteraceae bacterium]